MPNKTFTFFSFLLFSTIQLAFSQSSLSTNLLERISNETCDCLSAEKPPSGESAEMSNMNIGQCLMQVSANNQEELESEGVRLDTADAIEQLGEKVGEQLATSCNTFIALLFNDMMDKSSSNSVAKEKKESSADLKLIGTVNKVEAGLFLRFWVEHDKGADVFICQESFEGMDVIKDLEALKGKEVTVSYEIISVYSPMEQSMIEMKKVKGIRIVE